MSAMRPRRFGSATAVTVPSSLKRSPVKAPIGPESMKACPFAFSASASQLSVFTVVQLLAPLAVTFLAAMGTTSWWRHAEAS